MFEKAYAFDDIDIIPAHYPADIPEQELPNSRKDVSLRTRISRAVTLNTPILTSYMWTVTEAEMAIAMARLGGMGIIHRWMSIEEEARQVERVKRAENVVIDKPYTAGPTASVGEIFQMMRQHRVGGILITNEKGNLLGIVTTRDIDLEEDLSKTAGQVMTSRQRMVVARKGISDNDAFSLLKEKKLEKLPLVDKRGIVAGLVSRKDTKKRGQNRIATRDKASHLVVGAAVGIREKNYLDRVAALLAAGADVIVLAVANGYLPSTIRAVREMRRAFPEIDLLAGDVAEYEGAARLFQAGADGVLAGIGPGSACETRRVAGVGVPLFTSLLWCAPAARDWGGTIIADGGIRYGYPGDLVKAIAAGASAAIMGGVPAGTDEAPGEIVIVNGKPMKQHIGLASDRSKNMLDSAQGAGAARAPQEEAEEFYYHIEGEGAEDAFVPYRGSLRKVLMPYIGGLRSAMTYNGAVNLEDLWRIGEERRFVEKTEAGRREGNPHGLDIARE